MPLRSGSRCCRGGALRRLRGRFRTGRSEPRVVDHDDDLPTRRSLGRKKEVNYLDAVKYAQCMRTHGVPNMPDPTSDGSFLYDRGLLNGQRVDVRSAQYNSADKACTHLLPNGGKPTAAGLQYTLTQLLKYVRCLRTHGLPNTPDPVESKGGVGMRLPGNPNSPQVQSAMKACKSFAPGG